MKEESLFLELLKNKRKLPECAGKQGGVAWRREGRQSGPWITLNGYNPGVGTEVTCDAGP